MFFNLALTFYLQANFTNYQRQLENNILKNEVELQELRYDGKEENEKKLSGISSEEIYQSLQQGKTEEIEKIENRLHETEKNRMLQNTWNI